MIIVGSRGLSLVFVFVSFGRCGEILLEETSVWMENESIL